MLTTKKIEEILYKYRTDFAKDSRYTEFGIKEEDFHVIAIEIANLDNELPVDTDIEGYEMPYDETHKKDESIIPTFNNFLNESSENTIKKSQNTQNSLIEEIYKYFYEVFDENDKNRKANPWLNDVYKNLSPVIIEGDDVGLLLRSWVLEENEKISNELARILRVLLDARKKLKSSVNESNEFKEDSKYVVCDPGRNNEWYKGSIFSPNKEQIGIKFDRGIPKTTLHVYKDGIQNNFYKFFDNESEADKFLRAKHTAKRGRDEDDRLIYGKR